MFSNPNDLCNEFLGKGEGKAASGLKLTVNHNIFRRDNANAGKIEEEARQRKVFSLIGKLLNI